VAFTLKIPIEHDSDRAEPKTATRASFRRRLFRLKFRRIYSKILRAIHRNPLSKIRIFMPNHRLPLISTGLGNFRAECASHNCRHFIWLYSSFTPDNKQRMAFSAAFFFKSLILFLHFHLYNMLWTGFSERIINSPSNS